MFDHCDYDFQVLRPEVCYPISWQESKKYFQEKYVDETMSKVNRSLTAHVWNIMSSEFSLTKDSNVAYVKLAEKFCPRVLKSTTIF